MTTPKDQPDPTELQKSIEHVDAIFTEVDANPNYRHITFNPYHVSVLLSAAKRSQELEQRLQSCTTLTEQLVGALHFFDDDKNWVHVYDHRYGLGWKSLGTSDVDPIDPTKQRDKARKALLAAKRQGFE